jgi:hypothetical protein
MTAGQDWCNRWSGCRVVLAARSNRASHIGKALASCADTRARHWLDPEANPFVIRSSRHSRPSGLGHEVIYHVLDANFPTDLAPSESSERGELQAALVNTYR